MSCQKIQINRKVKTFDMGVKTPPAVRPGRIF